MEFDTVLPWLASPALLSARLLKHFRSPDEVFRASLRQLEACELSVAIAQAVAKKEAFRR